MGTILFGQKRYSVSIRNTLESVVVNVVGHVVVVVLDGGATTNEVVVGVDDISNSLMVVDSVDNKSCVIDVNHCDTVVDAASIQS